ncbi:MAG TPA: VCBS repeat-containing protein, partial [Polyangiales bacterium]|nr:VCBS repeat-containing protein [Polyangiales bacterium]
SASDRAPEGYNQSGSGVWAPAFIAWNGSTLLGPGQSVTASSYNAVGLPSGQTEEHDFDRDGVPEVLMYVSSVEHANSGTVEYRIYSRSGGTVHEYGPAAGLPIVGYVDFDDDSRLDLLVDTENALDVVGTHSSRRPEAWGLAHTLPDGTFSTTDAVARRYKP